MLAIQTEELTRYYDGLLAVDHLNLSINQGELFGFLGPNGAGKTTTIRLLSGLIRPSGGRAFVDGLQVSQNLLQVKARIGVVPERSNLYNELSLRANLIFMAKLYGLPRSQWQPRANELLDEFELAERADSPFASLSRGMKRRLTIAAALVHRPPILFLDEPTAGLDVQSARNLRAAIRTLHSHGVTIFLTTHLIAEAERLCNRVGIIVRGKLIALDTPAALCAQCQAQKAVSLVTPSPTETLLSTLRQSPEITGVSRAGDTLRLSVRSVDSAVRDIVSITQQLGASIEAIRTVNPTLEDAFVQLTGLGAEALQRKAAGSVGGGKG